MLTLEHLQVAEARQSGKEHAGLKGSSKTPHPACPGPLLPIDALRLYFPREHALRSAPHRPLYSEGDPTGHSAEDGRHDCAYRLSIKPTILSSVVTRDATHPLHPDERPPPRLSNQGLVVSQAEHPAWGRRRRVEKLVGVCVIVSGSAHGLVSPQHFQEWWGYGVFFMATAICLIGFGLALITDAIDPRYTPGDVNRIRRRMYAAGAIGIVGILCLYVLTRTTGIPLGPESGSVESVGVIDLVAKATEVLAVAGLVVLLVKSRPRLDL
jgi:hypothetical protein